jgi:hypothetical protein
LAEKIKIEMKNFLKNLALAERETFCEERNIKELIVLK